MLDIHPFMLSRWRKEYREGKIMKVKLGQKEWFGLLAVLPVAFFFTACFFLETIRSSSYVYFREDSLVEYLSAFSYLVAAFALAIAAKKAKDLRSMTLPIVLCFFCIVCLGEEVSWGQRIFNYNVASVERINVQGEFNLHNLEFFQRTKQSISITKRFFNAQVIFRYIFFGYFLVLPLLCKYNSKVSYCFYVYGGRLKAMRFFWAPMGLIILNCSLIILSREQLLSTILTEAREAIYAVCFAIHSVLLYRVLNLERKEKIV